jgi:predicted dehydrogenase
MNAAIVGAGGAGLFHALCFRARGVPVTHVFDPDAARRRNLAEVCGAREIDTLDAIAASDADCVSICSPPRWHVAQAERCARAGRTVFVEKPVAVAGDELTRLAALPGCVPIVQWRAGRALRAVHDAIAAWHLGPSPTVSVDLALHRSNDYFADDRESAKRWGCGALLSVGIHALDAVCFALSRAPLEVHAVVGGDDRDRNAAVLVTFAGGALLALRVTFEGGGPDEVRLAFCGNGVTATIAGGEVDPTAGAVRWKTADRRLRAELEAIESRAPGHVTGPLLVPYLGDAVDALRRGLTAGHCDALPNIGAVLASHEVALRAVREASRHPRG